MRFADTPVDGAKVVDLELLEDERGFFARAFCAAEFEQQGLKPTVAQANLSFNHRAGTLRGMHYQVDPAEETKLVRCTSGAIWDVIVDLRPDSSSYLEHFGVELSAANHRALYVPAMCAHGYQTLTDEAEVTYQVGDAYRPGHERGLAYDDPVLGIEWPLEVSVITAKDREWPRIGEREGARP